jgi:PAS domain-containing protein
MITEPPSRPTAMRRKCCRPGWTCSTRASRCSTPICAWWPGTAPFLELFDFPPQLAAVGTPLEHFIRYNAERGEYGPGDTEAQIAERVSPMRSQLSPQLRTPTPERPHSADARRAAATTRGFVTLYSDVTEQRYIEHLTEHQNNELEERVRRRTAQLENANANLRRANTENERIAAALGRSEERLRLINDTIPILIGYVDHNEVYQYANKGYSDWYGHPEGCGDRAGDSRRDRRPRLWPGPRVGTQGAVRPAGHLRVPHAARRQGCLRAQHAGPRDHGRRRNAGFLRFLARNHRAEADAGRPDPGPENGGHRPADRRPGARLQQPAHRHHRQSGRLQDHRPDDAEVNEFVEPACNRHAAACS